MKRFIDRNCFNRETTINLNIPITVNCNSGSSKQEKEIKDIDIFIVNDQYQIGTGTLQDIQSDTLNDDGQDLTCYKLTIPGQIIKMRLYYKNSQNVVSLEDYTGNFSYNESKNKSYIFLTEEEFETITEQLNSKINIKYVE